MRHGLAVLALAAGCAGPASPDPFGDLEATGWVWTLADAARCERAYRFTVSPDRRTIRLGREATGAADDTPPERTDYVVRGSGPRHIDLFDEDETGRDPEGRPVWWRLSFLEDGRIVWLRSDWGREHRLRPMTPCVPPG